MKAFKLNDPIPELHPIGSISVLGATPLEGDPQAAIFMVYGEPQDAFSCGLFSATQGTFSMTYPFTEQVTVLEGEVELTEEATGITTRYQKGDTWFAEQGTTVLWRVITPRFVKCYLANVEKR